MGKVIAGFFSIIFLTVVFITFQDQEKNLRNLIVFEDEAEIVRDSLERMNELMAKMPTNTQRVNYFMDRDGYLYLGAERIAQLEGAINSSKVRNDIAFKNFEENEIDEFFNPMAFLLKNHIDAVDLERPLGKFLFNYRRTRENTYNDLRFIMIVNSSEDTTSNYFRGSFNILNKKGNLILILPSDI